MVVGNGLIANAFNQYKYNENIIIFASGVSNSKTTNVLEFKRELDLISEYLLIPDKKFIYFSTCSISDGSIISDYINHKIHIEELIRNNHNNYIIFRLPIVVGVCDNKNTFFNRFRHNIMNGETIRIYRNLTRYLIDIDDISQLLPNIIESSYNNFTVDVCFENCMNIPEIVNIMEKISDIKCDKILETTEYDNVRIYNNEFLNMAKSYGFEYELDYTEKIIRKYL
jgi:UDP-2-acetamido-2,6-beta-L-arabino-hexul-4-ose reductase